MKKGKVALLFNSRNNYNLFEDIFFKHTTVDFSNYYIFNIDLNSHLPEQKEIAKRVFDKYNVIDIKVDYNDPDIFCATRTMELCIDYIEKNNLDVEWILWYSHDCHMIGDDFMVNLEEKLDRNPVFKEKVGSIGFCDYNTPAIGVAVYGRGCLMADIRKPEYGCNYKNLPPSYGESEYFIVEVPQDNGALFNIDLYKKYVKVDRNFMLYNWMDDACHQMAINGIPSITIPSLEMADLYREKTKFGITRSITSDSTFHVDTYHRAHSHNQHWPNKYGFPRPPADPAPFVRKYHSIYKKSIQKHLINWKITDGPKKLEDLNE